MLIGITGLPCSGTDSVGGFLVEKGFVWLSYSDILREELRKQGKEVTRQALQDLGNSIRKNHGPGELSKRLVSRMKPGGHYVVGTIRNPGEVAELRKVPGFMLVAITAPQSERFARMQSRNRENDPRTFEEFLELEKKESGEGQESTGLHLKATMEMADRLIHNGGSLQELRTGTEELLKELNPQNL